MIHRPAVLALLLTLSPVALAGDEGKAGRPDPRDELLVNGAWLESELGNEGIVVLHAGRDRAGYEAGHVPGARFVAWNDVAVERDGVPNELPPVPDLQALVRRLGVDGDDIVVIYDDEKGVVAARVYFALDYVGLGEQATLLDGQWKRWVAEGRAVAKEAPDVRPSEYTVRPRPEILTSLAAIQDSLAPGATKKTLLLDARPPLQFTGEEAGDGISRPGHIPGARSVFFEDNLAPGDAPGLKPIGELRAYYEERGIAEAEEIVSYCRSGGQASLTYFVLKYLGYDPKLYDGSFAEWSAGSGTPVETGPETK